MSITSRNWSIFKILSLVDSEQNYLQNKYCIAHHTLQMLLHYLVKLQCSKNRINSKIHHRRTLIFEVFFGCTCLISFSRQIRVSIKNYEISVRIKYSVRDLIYDIHICAWQWWSEDCGHKSQGQGLSPQGQDQGLQNCPRSSRMMTCPRGLQHWCMSRND